MAKALRWLGYGLGGLLVLLLVAAAVIYVLSERALHRQVDRKPSHLATSTATPADAQRMLYTLGCVSCHGEGLTGQKFAEVDGVFTTYAPNVSRLAAKASDAELDQAIRQGVGADGRALYIMPSRVYQFLTDAEVATLIAGIRALPAKGSPQPPIKLGPLGRVAVAMGKFPDMPSQIGAYRDSPLPSYGAQFAKGQHLVQTSCAECHGPQLGGQEVEPGVVAPSLDIAGAYDRDQFRTLMRTGVPPSAKDLGLMKQVAIGDFSHLHDEEIDAIHAYLVERANRQP